MNLSTEGGMRARIPCAGVCTFHTLFHLEHLPSAPPPYNVRYPTMRNRSVKTEKGLSTVPAGDPTNLSTASTQSS